MSTLKKRIESLSKTTQIAEVREACETAMNKFVGNITPTTPFSQSSIVEESIANSLFELLEGVEDTVVKDFISTEKRIMGMNNLGVRSAIKAVMEDELSKNVTVKYIIEKLVRFNELPEWIAAEPVAETLTQFDWSPVVREHLEILKTNLKEYSEDIKIYKAVAEAKSNKSSYLMSVLEKEIEKYLHRRTATNRAALLETLSKYIFDPTIKNLYNVIVESASGFQIKADSNDAYFKKVFSPVHVNEGVEYFTVYGKAFSKKGDNVAPLTEGEIEYLPENFMWAANFINQPNVEVSESSIKIFSRDKKVEILDENGVPSFSINGKKVSMNEFEKIYLNSGVFRLEEREVLSAVHKLAENWSSLCELDFVKSIFSHSNKHRRADVFSCGDKLHINRVDAMMNENTFHADCNGTQSRNMILEFMNYDLGNTFKNMLSKEEIRLNELEAKKKEYLDAIGYLETRKNKINSIEDVEIRESTEMKEIFESISEEIQRLKNSYAEVIGEIKNFTTLSEGIGVNVNDEVEHLKKKQG
jgi:hypothetical protein